MTQPLETPRSERIIAIDVLRGIVMILMALDHARDFYGNALANPLNLQSTTPALFMTRWVTHFCAPVFVFLAGTSAWLYGRRVASTAKLARFLFTRGLFLVVLEVTVVSYGWMLSFDAILMCQVIAAIGCAMMVLAALIWLPLSAVVAVGLVIVCGHNTLDSVQLTDFGEFAWFWNWMHVGFMGSGVPVFPFGRQMWIIYPLLPWIGVITCGYGFGAFLTHTAEKRRVRVLQLGLTLVALFIVLRLSNVYGDTAAWSSQETGLKTFFSFINCQKYPPSLSFLCMTLGPAMIALAALDRRPGRLANGLATFGRVPLFYYIAHIYLLHLSSVLLYRLDKGESMFMHRAFTLEFFTGAPAWYGYSLPVVYAGWIATALLLYPACRWFAGVKRRNKSAWLSYL